MAIRYAKSLLIPVSLFIAAALYAQKHHPDSPALEPRPLTPEKSLELPVTRAEFDALSARVSAVETEMHPPAAVSFIDIAESPPSLTVGETAQLTVVVRDAESNILDRPVSWTSTPQVSVSATGLVTALTDGPATITVTCETITDEISLEVLPVVVPPPPPDPVTGSFTQGEIPPDGYKATSVLSVTGHRFEPDVVSGQRLSGTVSIGVKAETSRNIPLPVPVTDYPHRLLVDGIPQTGFTLDTTKIPDGPHVLAVQIMDPKGNLDLRNGSRIVVVNNSGFPYTGAQQVIADGDYRGTNKNSLAWGRVTVHPPKEYPLEYDPVLTPDVTTDEQRAALAMGGWWVEGLSHQPTGLFITLPLLVKNLEGDHYIQQWNPEGPSKSVDAVSYVDTAPAYDGPRGINWLNPYSTLVAYPQKILASGHSGWLGVDLSGRVVTVDVTGEVTTIFGPRSVAGVVGTDPHQLNFTLEDRLKAGEKEHVGDHRGLPLKLAQDIWVCESFPFEGNVADTGNNRVAEIRFEEQRLMRSWTVPGVTSVWNSKITQQEQHIAWFAASPAGLWCQKLLLDATGKPTGHAPVELLASIPKAHWVRGDGHRVYVFTLHMGIWEYDARTGITVNRVPDSAGVEFPFVFADVDVNGAIGPRGMIYLGGVTGATKTSMRSYDPNTWVKGSFHPAEINGKNYMSWQASVDSMGHYLWGFAIHGHMPKFLVTGITESSWKMWTGYPDERPIPDLPAPSVNVGAFAYGRGDTYLGLGTLFGSKGHGGLGYTVDEFRDYKTVAEALPAMRLRLDPMLPADMPQAEKDAMYKHMFNQRTRRHFQ